MRRGILILILVLAFPAPAHALTKGQLREAAGDWASWMDGDTGELGYFIRRCRRIGTGGRCAMRLVATEFGTCTATVYVRKKRRNPSGSEIVYRRKWVVGITDAGLDCLDVPHL